MNPCDHCGHDSRFHMRIGGANVCKACGWDGKAGRWMLCNFITPPEAQASEKLVLLIFGMCAGVAVTGAWFMLTLWGSGLLECLK